MRKSGFSVLIGVLFFLGTQTVNASGFQFGDIIFQQSDGSRIQSRAIMEATNSPWTHVGIIIEEKGRLYVYEAIQPVSRTPLTRWIRRGHKNIHVVKRMQNSNDLFGTSAQRQALVNELRSHLGRGYDIYFEWSDNLLYCSEYVYKALENVFGVEVGQEVPIKALNTDGPNVSKLIQLRYDKNGKKVNWEDPIVSPQAMYESHHLKTIYDSRVSQKLQAVE